MLKVRVIPTLLWKSVGLVKGVAFDSWRRVGSVLPAVKVYNMRDVDELVLLDIAATVDKSEPDYDAIADFADECSVPLTVGGGINCVEQIASILRVGADKVCINTAAYLNPDLVTEAASRFGAQCVVVSIDVRRQSDGHRTVWVRAGTHDTGESPVEFARRMQARGCGEILLTSIDRDGTLQGYDLELIEMVTSQVDIPVIASGGAGTYQHMVDALQRAGASAVAAASMFHFTEQTPAGAKQVLVAAGLPVRRNFSLA